MRHEDRLTLAQTLAWTLLIAAWLQLGALGHAAWPLTATGLLPIALWLAVVGLARQAVHDIRLGSWSLRLWLAGSGAATAAALLGASAAPTAVFAAAAGWGLLLVAVSRGQLAQRRGAGPLPVAASAAGAAMAWAGYRAGVGASAALVAGAALGLALLVPADARSRVCRGGLLDCLLPALSACPTHATDWLRAALRWAMLPMMATLAAMGDWCSADLGLSAQVMVALHLTAMLLPPMALRLCACQHRSPLWAALALLAALLLLGWPPAKLRGLPGLGAASLACAAAWGLALQAHRPGWPALAQPIPADSSPTRTAPVEAAPTEIARLAPFALALAPALAVVALGLAIEHFGPPALGGALALVSAIALAGAAWFGTRQLLPPLSRQGGRR